MALPFSFLCREHHKGAPLPLLGTMAQETTAEELLARVAARDEGALGEFYERFAPRLLGMLLRILAERSSAEEVLQDIFVRLWNEAERLARPGASLAAWLVITARQRAIEQRRAERKRLASARGSADPLEKSTAWLPRPKESALLDERRELLKKVLNQLPTSQRQALELAVFDGLTEDEIAQELRQPLAKVRSELRASMTFLRHRLRAVLGTWAANI